MSSYGFIFPKQGKSINGAVKDLVWRDDQQILLAQDRVTAVYPLTAGTNIHGMQKTLNLTVEGRADYYVYKSFVTAEWNGQSRTFSADATQPIDFAGAIVQVSTVLSATGVLTFNFEGGIGSTILDSDVTLTVSAYLCLQCITDNGTSYGATDTDTIGFKVSLPGISVDQATPKQCSLHSNYTALKVRYVDQVSLTANNWTQIPHIKNPVGGYGYEPAYYGFFNGTSAGLTGIIPFGGGKDISGHLSEDPRIQSYTTTDSLYLLSTINTTATYYLFADQAGKVLNNSDNYVTPDDYGDYGLIISKHGTDILNAKPNKLEFCSKYNNFKVHSELVGGGAAITPADSKTTDNIGQDDTTINFANASAYGNRGEFYIAKKESVPKQDWHWTAAADPAFMINWDSQAEDKTKIVIHAEGGVFEGVYQNGSFSGDARYTGNDGSRRFQFYKGGNWNTCDAGWTEGACPQWDNGWTWYRGNDEWVEVYVGQWEDDACWFNLGKWEQIETFYQEKVSFTGNTGTAFTGCTRGIDGTSARSWGSGSYIVPVKMCYEIASNPFNYNPVFMGWLIGPFDTDARCLPNGTGSENYNIILSGGKFYFTVARSYEGETDGWFSPSALPFVTPNCYIKIFYDEIGT